MSDLFTRIWVRVGNALYREEGQALTEYAVVIVLIAAIAGMTAFTGIRTTIIEKISNALGGLNP